MGEVVMKPVVYAVVEETPDYRAVVFLSNVKSEALEHSKRYYGAAIYELHLARIVEFFISNGLAEKL
jgi:hypothetical protein